MARTKQLNQTQVDTHLKNLSGWKVNTKYTMLSKEFAFPTFVSALAYVAKVAVHAEVVGHHPDIELSYGKVKVKLTTHDVKGLTAKDFDLATRIEALRTN